MMLRNCPLTLWTPLDLMLDISGYKIEDEDVEISAHAAQQILENDVEISNGIDGPIDECKW